VNFKSLVLLVIGVWLGILIGISFIEAPLKFRAPGITMKLGVGIGKIVFNFSNKIQIGLLLFVLVYFLYKKCLLTKMFLPTTLMLVGIAAIQTFYLLPILDERAMRLMNNQAMSPSFHHIN